MKTTTRRGFLSGIGNALGAMAVAILGCEVARAIGTFVRSSPIYQQGIADGDIRPDYMISREMLEWDHGQASETMQWLQDIRARSKQIIRSGGYGDIQR